MTFAASSPAVKPPPRDLNKQTNIHLQTVWMLNALLVIVRLQRSPGWRDMEYGARELWQLEVCSSVQRFHPAWFLWNKCFFFIILMCAICSRPVHGLIFLFKWQPGEEPAGSIVQDSRLDQIFFAKQVRLFFIIRRKYMNWTVRL